MGHLYIDTAKTEDDIGRFYIAFLEIDDDMGQMYSLIIDFGGAYVCVFCKIFGLKYMMEYIIK